MPNGTYGGVRGKETKVGQKTFASRPTRLLGAHSSYLTPIFEVLGRGGTSLHVATRDRLWIRNMGRADTLYKLLYPSFVTPDRATMMRQP